MELGFVANLAPAFVVAILFAAARIASGCLNVPVCDGTDPDVFVGGWNGERLDAPELGFVFNGFAVGIEIGKVPAAQFARDAGARVIDVA